MTTHGDDITQAFRSVYQVVVDQVDLPGDNPPLHRVEPSEPGRRLGWTAALVAGLVVVVAIGGVSLLPGGGALVGSTDSVERVALLGDSEVLGGDAVVVNSSVTASGFYVMPPVDMWEWRDATGASVMMFETTPDADLTPLIGTTVDGAVITSPAEGGVDVFESLDTGWQVASWVAEGRWQLVAGFDPAVVDGVRDAVQQQRGAPDTVGDFDLARRGPQWVHPSSGVELSELFYSSAAGGFSVGLFRGWPDGADGSRLRTEGAQVVDINEAEAVLAGDSLNWWVSWPVDEASTAVVSSSDLTAEQIIELARHVEPVSVGAWGELADDATTPMTFGSPTPSAFDAVGDPTVLASGEAWSLFAQAVTVPGIGTSGGGLGLCSCLEVGGGVSTDWGCMIGEGVVETWPNPVRLPDDSVVVTGTFRREVAEIRFLTGEGNEIVTRNVVVHESLDVGVFAAVLPSWAETQFTLWDSAGNRLPIGALAGQGRMEGTLMRGG